jgi:hypothetical protein
VRAGAQGSSARPLVTHALSSSEAANVASSSSARASQLVAFTTPAPAGGQPVVKSASATTLAELATVRQQLAELRDRRSDPAVQTAREITATRETIAAIGVEADRDRKPARWRDRGPHQVRARARDRQPARARPTRTTAPRRRARPGGRA